MQDKPPLYRDSDARTIVPRGSDYRSAYRRDVARLIHSPAFRRLQGKTQLFAGLESDFFRNRLTHSLEVAQIAKSVALKLNHDEALRDLRWQVDLDVVEFAGLAHDLGHPPFGHTGEEVLHELMQGEGGFEGNAQTFRLLARLEKRLDGQSPTAHPAPRFYDDTGGELSTGLNISARSLASVVKYDHEIPRHCPSSGQNQQRPSSGQNQHREELVKGYYASEAEPLRFVRAQVAGPGFALPLKTLECQIMDLADDIAYSTYDIEDAIKAGIFSQQKLLAISTRAALEISQRVNSELAKEGYAAQIAPEDVSEIVFEAVGKIVQLPVDAKASFGLWQRLEEGEFRSLLASMLIHDAVTAIECQPDLEQPALSRVRMAERERIRVSLLKHLTYVQIIGSDRMKLVSHRGIKIVKTLFENLLENPELLPADFRERHEQAPGALKKRVICDFVAGMTDRYAVEFYARLTSESFRSMFQPL